MSCYACVSWFLILIIQTFVDDKNELEKNFKMNEHQKTKQENEHLQSVFLTFILLFFNALILLLFNEDDKLQRNNELSPENKYRKILRSKSVYSPAMKAAADKARKLNELKKICITINQESTLRKHYDLLMTALYIITTISSMENIIHTFGNLLTINSKILSLVASFLLL